MHNSTFHTQLPSDLSSVDNKQHTQNQSSSEIPRSTLSELQIIETVDCKSGARDFNRDQLLSLAEDLNLFLPDPVNTDYLRHVLTTVKNVQSLISTDTTTYARDALDYLIKTGTLTTHDRTSFPLLAAYEKLRKFPIKLNNIYDTVSREDLTEVTDKNMAPNDHKPFIKPDTFSGSKSDNFKAWKKEYNRAAKVNKWTEEDQLNYLPIYLKKTALDVFDIAIDGKAGMDYGTAMEILNNKFGNPVHGEHVRMLLEDRNKMPQESYTEYIADINKLCLELDLNMPEPQIITYIMRGLDVGALQQIGLMDNNTIKQVEQNLVKYERSKYLVDRKLSKHQTQNLNLIQQDKSEISSLKNKITSLEHQLKTLQVHKPANRFKNNTQENQYGFNPRIPNNYGRGYFQKYQPNTQITKYGVTPRLNNPQTEQTLVPYKSTHQPPPKYCVACKANTHRTIDCYKIKNQITQETNVKYCTNCKKLNHDVTNCYHLTKNGNTGPRH